MSLINSDYFIGELLIPNLLGGDIVPTANRQVLDQFIAKYEPHYLLYVLGEELYEAFKAGLAANPVAQKWTDLKAQIVDETAKLSSIAGFVYYHYARHKVTASTAMGEVEAKAENATTYFNSDKMVRAFNESVRDGRLIRSWLIDHATTYTEFDPSSTYGLTVINSFGI